MKTDKLLQFLYGESQVKEDLDGISDDLLAVFEEMEHEESLEPKKGPLSAALKEIGADLGTLEVDPSGFIASTDDEAKYNSCLELLKQADSIHKLAELGWVFANIGDSSRTSEESAFKIRFLELTTAEAGDKDKASEKPEAILKAARKFATEPMKRDSGFKKPKGDGVGKATDGEAATSAKKESLDSAINKMVQEKIKFGAIAAVKPRRIGKLRKSLNLQNPQGPTTA